MRWEGVEELGVRKEVGGKEERVSPAHFKELQPYGHM